MKRFMWATAFVAVVTVGVAPALADSPHFKRGGSPTCTVATSSGSSSTTCHASLAGLGNGDLVINTTVRGSATYTCTNQGGNAAPGQNKVQVGPVTAPTTIPSDQIKNGTVTFTTDPAVLSAPPTVSGAAAGCPNNNWRGTNPQLTTTSVTMTISQGGQLLFTCSATNPNGLSGTFALSC